MSHPEHCSSRQLRVWVTSGLSEPNLERTLHGVLCNLHCLACSPPLCPSQDSIEQHPENLRKNKVCYFLIQCVIINYFIQLCISKTFSKTVPDTPNGLHVAAKSRQHFCSQSAGEPQEEWAFSGETQSCYFFLMCHSYWKEAVAKVLERLGGWLLF